MRRLGISWPGAGKSTVDQTRFTAKAKSSRSSGHCSTPWLPCFMFPQTPPHARGARATEPAPCPMLRGRVYVMFLSDRATQEGRWTSPCHVHIVGLHRAADGSPCFEGGGPVPAALRGQPRSDQAPGPVATRPQQQLQLQRILRASSSRVTFPPRPGHCRSVPPPPLHVEADEPSASRPITRTRRCR